MGFSSQDISEFSVIPNAAQGESYSFMPCRMVSLRHFETLKLWELWNLHKEGPPRTTLDALDKAYLATMKCVVVNKAFRRVTEEQTKIKQVKSQLKALGCGGEHAGQRAGALG